MLASTVQQKMTRTAAYEQTTRWVRWIVIGVIAVTLPVDHPQSLMLWWLLVLGVVFNLSRYIPWLMRQRWYASYLTMLIVDSLFVVTFFIVWMYSSSPGLVISPLRSLILLGGLLAAYAILLNGLTHVERSQGNKPGSLEQQQTTHDNRLMTLINSVDNAMAEVNTEGNINVANTALSELSGARGELKGAKINSVLPLQHAFKGELNWKEVLRAAPVRYRDYFLIRDGRQVDVELSITPIGKSSTESGYIIICHDITQDRSLDEQRQEFVAVTSHELRTPVAIIEGSLSMALTKLADKEPEIKALLQQAHRNTQFLGQLVQDLTLLAKAQDDSLEIQPQVVDPKILTDQLVHDYMSMAQEKDLVLKSEVKSGTPTVLTTQSHVEEILRNFISNGIKYTEKGEVIVRAEPIQKGGVLFSVQDSGIGLSQQDQSHLFTRFFRAEDYKTRETGGSGLGLYISQEIALRINAKLWCTSELGKGSTFYLEVPPFSKLAKDQDKVVTAGITNLVDQI